MYGIVFEILRCLYLLFFRERIQLDISCDFLSGFIFSDKIQVAEDSNEMSSLIFSEKYFRMSSAAVLMAL